MGYVLPSGSGLPPRLGGRRGFQYVLPGCGVYIGVPSLSLSSFSLSELRDHGRFESCVLLDDVVD